MSTQQDDFFVGYSSRLSRRTIGFLATTGASLLIMAGLFAFSLGAGTADPGDGRFIGGGANLQKLVGYVDLDPYPILRTLPDENGNTRALPLTGAAKFGVDGQATELQGQIVDVEGFILRRGDLDMINVNGGCGKSFVKPTALDLTPAQMSYVPGDDESLGRWRLVGEICDGKCYAGVMRPGNGIAHLAFADLCLIGGVPPVFVSTGDIEGENFFWLADADGGPLPDDFYPYVALRIGVEGEVERRDDIMIFKIDLSTVEVF